MDRKRTAKGIAAPPAQQTPEDATSPGQEKLQVQDAPLVPVYSDHGSTSSRRPRTRAPSAASGAPPMGPVDDSPVTMAGLVDLFRVHQASVKADVDAQLIGFMGKAEKLFERHTAGIKRGLATSDEESEYGDDYADNPLPAGSGPAHSATPSVTDHGPPTHVTVTDVTEPDQTDVTGPTGTQPAINSTKSQAAVAGVDTDPTHPSLELGDFERAKARIAEVIPNCDLVRQVLISEGDLFQTSFPTRQEKQVQAAGPASLPLSVSTRRALELCNEQLRGTREGTFHLRETYSIDEMLLPKDQVTHPLPRGTPLPLHPTLGFRRADFPVAPHGTAIEWHTKSPKDTMAAIGQDCTNVLAGLSFIEQSVATVLHTIERAKNSSGTDEWRSVLNSLDDVAPALTKTLCNTSYHAARGHCNAVLHARGAQSEAEKKVADVLWTAPAEVACLDSLRTHAKAQVRDTRRGDFIDNIVINFASAADAARTGKAGPSKVAGHRKADKRQKTQGPKPGTSKSVSKVTKSTPPKKTTSGPFDGSHHGNKAPKTPKYQKSQQSKGRGQPRSSSSHRKGDQSSL